MRFHSFMLSVLSIGLAMVGLEPRSANSQVPACGNQARHRSVAVLETSSQSSVPSFTRNGGLLGLVRPRTPAPMMQTVYLNAAPSAPAPAWHNATPTFPLPSPSHPAHASGYNFPAHYPAPHQMNAPGSGPAIVLLVLMPSPSITTGSIPGTWMHGPAPMSPPWSASGQMAPVLSGPLPGPTFHPMGFAATQGQLRSMSQ